MSGVAPDPLDRIEKTARLTVAAFGKNAYARDVLALVEVARAARVVRDAAWLDAPPEVTDQLEAALARLDKQDLFEGTCDVCGAAISTAWDRSRGIIDIGLEEDGRVYTWIRHYATAPEGANPDCAIYSSRVWRVEVPE